MNFAMMSGFDEWFSKFKDRFINDFITDNRWKYLWNGLGVTMKITLGVKFVLGVLAAMCVAPSSAADAEAHRDAFTLEGPARTNLFRQAASRWAIWRSRP